jgi:hypothetical protein
MNACDGRFPPEMLADPDVVWLGPGTTVLAIFSDHNGDPYTGTGRIGHVVRIGSSTMPVVNEFTDGGVYEHEDCAPACVASRIRESGIVTSVRQIELLAGTGPQGTLFPGIERALRFFGVACDFSTGAPAPGWIMNPAGGRLLDPSNFPEYLRASQGGCIVCADPATPPRPPIPIEEPEMQTFVIKPGDAPLLVPGLTGATSLNLVASAGATVTLWIWKPDGTGPATKTVTLPANDPNVHGPEQVSGYLYQIFGLPATYGPCTLALDAASAEYSASLH